MEHLKHLLASSVDELPKTKRISNTNVEKYYFEAYNILFDFLDEQIIEYGQGDTKVSYVLEKLNTCRLENGLPSMEGIS